MSSCQTIVVKLGTSVLTGGSRKLNRAHMVELVRQCAQMQQAGHRMVIVTSGAIAAGREHLGYPDLPHDGVETTAGRGGANMPDPALGAAVLNLRPQYRADVTNPC